MPKSRTMRLGVDSVSVGVTIACAMESALHGALVRLEFDNGEAVRIIKDVRSPGILRPLGSMDLGPEKVRMFTVNRKLWSLNNRLEICLFVSAPGHTCSQRQIRDIVEAVTGWDTRPAELLRAGERALTLTTTSQWDGRRITASPVRSPWHRSAWGGSSLPGDQPVEAGLRKGRMGRHPLAAGFTPGVPSGMVVDQGGQLVDHRTS